MSLTKLDDACAFIVIDLQKGMSVRRPFILSARSCDRAARLARAFRERDLPVVLVNVTGAASGRTDAVRPKYSLPDD